MTTLHWVSLSADEHDALLCFADAMAIGHGDDPVGLASLAGMLERISRGAAPTSLEGIILLTAEEVEALRALITQGRPETSEEAYSRAILLSMVAQRHRAASWDPEPGDAGIGGRSFLSAFLNEDELDLLTAAGAEIADALIAALAAWPEGDSVAGTWWSEHLPEALHMPPRFAHRLLASHMRIIGDLAGPLPARAVNVAEEVCLFLTFAVAREAALAPENFDFVLFEMLHHGEFVDAWDEAWEDDPMLALMSAHTAEAWFAPFAIGRAERHPLSSPEVFLDVALID